MKKVLFFLLVLTSFVFAAQTGIYFQPEGSFIEALKKARSENKFLFVTCFAKRDDMYRAVATDVFGKSNVGAFMNGRFISVSIQFDTLAIENKAVANLRGKIANAGFPAYLFFTPEGKLVHRGAGYKDADSFVRLAMEARNPARQYYTLQDKYNCGEKDYPTISYLLEKARELKDSLVAEDLVRDYLNKYLVLLSGDQLYTRKNISFLAGNVRSGDRLFELFLRNAHNIDSIMGKVGYSQDVIDYVITVEEIDPKLGLDVNSVCPAVEKPDWDKMIQSITKKFGAAYAERTVINAKLRWYSSKKEWTEYGYTVVGKVEKYGVYGFEGAPDEVKWNELAWDMFLHCNDSSVLKKALLWSETSMKLGSISMGGKYDTYANLLYKLGRREEAISWEEKAVQLEPESADIKNTLEKMKKGEPTWRK